MISNLFTLTMLNLAIHCAFNNIYIGIGITCLFGGIIYYLNKNQIILTIKNDKLHIYSPIGNSQVQLYRSTTTEFYYDGVSYSTTKPVLVTMEFDE